MLSEAEFEPTSHLCTVLTKPLPRPDTVIFTRSQHLADVSHFDNCNGLLLLGKYSEVRGWDRDRPPASPIRFTKTFRCRTPGGGGRGGSNWHRLAVGTK